MILPVSPFFLFGIEYFRKENADYYYDNQRFIQVIPLRFERRTHALEGRCSIQLSYGTILICECKGSAFYETTKKNWHFFMYVFLYIYESVIYKKEIVCLSIWIVMNK